MDKREKLYELLNEKLGYAGRLLSASKSGYMEAHPGHYVFFNACAFVKLDDGSYEQVWHGDVDMNLEARVLSEVADALDAPFYITGEHPYRWSGLTDADIRDNERVREILPARLMN